MYVCTVPVYAFGRTGFYIFREVMGLDQRLGVVGIVVEDRTKAAQVNAILSSFGEIIVGRMGIPYRERGLSVISIIVDGTTDEIGAMTGKLGNIKGVQVKSALSNRL